MFIVALIAGCNKERERLTSPEISTDNSEATLEEEAFEFGNYLTSPTSSCAGQTSPGNPYGCCRASKNARDHGNCVWWAWKMAQDEWGINLPNWNIPRTWVAKAKKDSRFSVSSAPAVNAIAVSSKTTVKCSDGKPCGHVAWVTKIINSSTIEVSEMNCKSGPIGYRTKRYPVTFFNVGFISKKATAPSTPTVTPVPTPQITGVSPNPFPKATNWEKRVLTVSGRDFQSGAKLEFKIVGTSYVYPDRVPTFVNSNTLTYNISVGPNVYTWTVQVINPNGKSSNVYTFQVK